MVSNTEVILQIQEIRKKEKMLCNIWNHGCAWLFVNLAPCLVVSASWSTEEDQQPGFYKALSIHVFLISRAKKPPCITFLMTSFVCCKCREIVFNSLVCVVSSCSVLFIWLTCSKTASVRINKGYQLLSIIKLADL